MCDYPGYYGFEYDGQMGIDLGSIQYNLLFSPNRITLDMQMIKYVSCPDLKV